jgi:hypothetical protein
MMGDHRGFFYWVDKEEAERANVFLDQSRYLQLLLICSVFQLPAGDRLLGYAYTS